MTEDTQLQEFDLHSVFNKKDNADAALEEKEDELPKKKEPVKEVKKEPVQDSVDEENDPGKDPEVKKEESVKEKSIDYQSENEKLKKTLKDTQKSFHEDRRKLSAYTRAVERMKEDGTLLEDEANLLLDHTRYEESDINENKSGLTKYDDVWNKELQYMYKYSSDAADINKNVTAFQHLLRASSAEEIEEIFYDLAQYEDDEVQLTKRMISYGREYNDEVYSDIHEAGSIRKLKSKYQSEMDSLKKELDTSIEKYNNLKKKYQDYDTEPGSQRFSSGAGNVDHKKEVTFDVGAIFNKQYQRR